MASASVLGPLFGRSGKHFLCRNAAVRRRKKDCNSRRKGCKRVLYSKGTYAHVVSGLVCFLLSARES